MRVLLFRPIFYNILIVFISIFPNFVRIFLLKNVLSMFKQTFLRIWQPAGHLFTALKHNLSLDIIKKLVLKVNKEDYHM